MAEPLISPTFLYRFAAPCAYLADLGKKWPLNLPESFALPCFAALEGRPPLAELRMAWSEAGLGVSLRVTGKRQPPWCRDSRIDDSDGLELWIDTRNTQNIHRAGRFCHRFAFLPTGGGRTLGEPIATLLAINRAKESPREIDLRRLRVHSELKAGGYLLDAFVPTETLTGFNPMDQPQIGFTYALNDRELGSQTFTVGREFPFDEDPSLWGTLELVK